LGSSEKREGLQKILPAGWRFFVKTLFLLERDLLGSIDPRGKDPVPKGLECESLHPPKLEGAVKKEESFREIGG
jgi:hypothetical protein